MRNVGHEDGLIPEAEVEARSLTAIVYREYLDAGYLIPKTNKLIDGDINEPIFSHRVPGTVIYVHPYTRLHIHVWNCDKIPHSFHTHGLEYGIDSDGAWPFGTQTTDGRRSDEICPDQKWTYIFEVYPEMIGIWPFHDHAQGRYMRISAGLFGGIVVLPWYEPLPENLGLPLFLIDRFLKPLFEVEGKEDLQVDRIKPENQYILQDAIDFFEEYMEKEVVQFMPRPIPIPLPFPLPFPFPIQKFPRTDHVPVFFHLMSTGETKPLFVSGDIPELVGFFELTFDEEGMFDYFCQFHPEMTGTVHVTAGGPANATVNIIDGPPMGFSPTMIMISIGGTVRWENLSIQHHTVTSSDGANLFDPSTETYTETNSTMDARFYSTTFTLADGRAITLFGSNSKSMEIYTPGLGWSAPVNFPLPDFSHHQYYPWTYQLPDGRLFIAGPHDPTHRFDLNNPAVFDAFPTINGNRSTGGEKASSVMQILRPPAYEPRILIIGGNTAATEQTAEIINMADATPAWTALPNLNEPRNRQFTSVLLPDGRIFISGGVSGGADGGPCEIYDPQNPGDGWIPGPHMTHKREYHSSIILLADGSIVAGGDPRVGGVPTPHERYYPNYFTVVRPTFNNAPTNINFGASFVIDTPDGLNIGEVILLRPGAVTHGYNMTQRGVECVIDATAANLVNAVAPPDANIAPPGWYLLFILDIDRVPSIGRWIRLTT